MAGTHGSRTLAALAIALGAAGAHAEVSDTLDRASLSLGVFYPDVDTRIAANGAMFNDTDLVDFQRDLGLDKRRALANARFEFRVFDNQTFSFGGYRYSKHGGATLDRDIHFDGADYQVDAFVDARLNLDTWHAAWHWWLAPTQGDSIGLGLGAVYYRVEGVIDGGITVNDGSAGGRASAQADAIAPLLTIGWRHAFTADFRLYADLSGVRKPSGTLTGHLVNGTLGLEWFPWQNLGFSLEYSENNLDLKADKESWEGRARIHFRGPAAFVRMRF
jgi:hypothetical protein